MTMVRHLCASCRHLERTSEEQVFLRCRWHCEQPYGDVLRCHVQPWADACGHYAPATPDGLHWVDVSERRAG